MKTELSPTERKVMNIFANGGKYTAADITVKTMLCDPRSIIASMRKKGVKILDEWRKCVNSNGRYKVYFIG